jgi:hypothetical protein
MKIIYIDSEFKCHVSNDGTMTAIETEIFDDKCDTFIEGYRFVPAGSTWVRSDGVQFTGEMAAPWKDYSELDAAQREYERQLIKEYRESLKIVGIEV